jgi:threonine dehydrogenase-like Zn-dependent dehydrogenase
MKAVSYKGPHRTNPTEGMDGAAYTPSFLVSHELPLDEAVTGYDRFDQRESGWTKVLLRPAG